MEQHHPGGLAAPFKLQRSWPGSSPWCCIHHSTTGSAKIFLSLIRGSHDKISQLSLIDAFQGYFFWWVGRQALMAF